MGIDRSIAFAARVVYFVAAVSVLHVLTAGRIIVTWILGSGFVDIGSVYVYAGRPWAGYTLEGLAIGILLASGMLVRRNVSWAMLAAGAFILVDCLLFFGWTAAGGLVAAGIGLPASFLVVFHGIVFWCVIRAYAASRQRHINEFIVRRLDLEAKLKRKLDDSEAPAPPAATFTRYGSTPRT